MIKLSEKELKLTMVVTLITMVLTVVLLDFHGYINHSSPEDGAVVESFDLVSLRPGTEYKMSTKPSGKNAICVDGFILLQPDNGKAVAGLLVDHKKRGVRCQAGDFQGKP